MGHALSPLNFGSSTGAIQVQFHNGSSAVTGYIVKQVGSRRFVCTADGTNTFTCDLADNTGLATSLTAGYCTIAITPPGGGATEYVTSIWGALLFTTAGNQYPYVIGTQSSTQAGLSGRVVLVAATKVQAVTKNVAQPINMTSSVTGAFTSLTVVANGAHGTAVVTNATTITYTPVTNYTGGDVFTWKATNTTGDSNIANCTITVT
jgi:hypothetical protein